MDKRWLKYFKDPNIATEMSEYFYDLEKALEWIKHFRDPEKALKWAEYFDDLNTAIKWEKYFSDPDDAIKWANRFKDLNVAVEWAKYFNGYFELADKWASYFKKPEVAITWVEFFDNPEVALEWYNVIGNRPEVAHKFVNEYKIEDIDLVKKWYKYINMFKGDLELIGEWISYFGDNIETAITLASNRYIDIYNPDIAYEWYSITDDINLIFKLQEIFYNFYNFIKDLRPRKIFDYYKKFQQINRSPEEAADWLLHFDDMDYAYELSRQFENVRAWYVEYLLNATDKDIEKAKKIDKVLRSITNDVDELQDYTYSISEWKEYFTDIDTLLEWWLQFYDEFLYEPKYVKKWSKYFDNPDVAYKWSKIPRFKDRPDFARAWAEYYDIDKSGDIISKINPDLWIRYFDDANTAAEWCYYFENDIENAIAWYNYFPDIDEAMKWYSVTQNPREAYKLSLKYETPEEATKELTKK